MSGDTNHQSPYHVVIVGGGFAGLYTAKELGRSPVKVTLIDKRNFHLFQPLLYQVATGSLSPGDIASPLRSVLSRNHNTKVLMGEVTDIDPDRKKLQLQDSELNYDALVIATGVTHHYFGNDTWAPTAPGLKTVEDALEMRRRIFAAFEAAEKESDPAKRRALLTFVVIGGGPTGVELAGALAELAHTKLKKEFRNIDTTESQIFLLEGLDRLLPSFPEDLSVKAQAALEKLGVVVRTQTRVTQIEDKTVLLQNGGQTESIEAHTILWAAGVKASPLGEAIAQRTGAQLDRSGRVMVESDLSVTNYPDIFVIGDLANYSHQGNSPLPGVAPVAMQEGCYVANLIKKRLQNKALPPFRYVDYGSLAVIGRHEAVVNLNFARFSGILAWFTWLFVHIYYMIEFDNKLVVMIQWAWSYFTRQGGARLITGESLSLPGVEEKNGDYAGSVASKSVVET